MIKAILFDFGGVIYKHPKEVIPEVLSRIFLKPLNQTIPAYSFLKSDYFSGKMSTNKLINSLSKTLGTKKTVSEVKKLWLKYYGELAKPDKDVLEIIKNLRKLKYKIYLFSNTTEMSNLHNKNTGIYDYFDNIFLSYKLGLCKPNIEVYKLVLSKIGLDSSDCVFVDDDEKNLKPAEQLGMHTLMFDILKDKPKKLKDNLKQFNIEI